MTWRPLLAGADAARARAVARSIGDALVAALPLPLAGLGETAACLAYLAEEFPELAAGRDAAIEAAIDGLAGVATDASLFAGCTGVAWLAAHLGAGEVDELDDALPRLIDAIRDPGLITGLAGVGIYCVERLPDARAAAAVERLVAQLAGLAVAEPDGSLAWPVPGRDAGAYPVGVAHGTAGVVGLLARVVGVGAADDLLDRAVRWLLAQRVDGGFPAERGGSRCRHLAWCNGELGVAGVLLSAACATGSSAWLAEAVAIVRAAAAGDLDAVDGGLCHGAAGAALVFQRFWHVTGDPDLGCAAARWIDRAIAWLDRSALTLLTGAAGIGLAVVAAVSEHEPAWDRVLVLS